jgi:hypothetical protein
MLLEDGFVVMMTKETWKNVRVHLCDGKPFEVASDSDDQGVDFHCEWLQTAWQDPVTGASRQAPGGWALYTPDGKQYAAAAPYTPGAAPRPANEPPVYLHEVTLLSPDTEFQRLSNTEHLTAYVAKVAALVDAFYAAGHLFPSAASGTAGGSVGAFKLVLHFRLVSDRDCTLELKSATLPAGPQESLKLQPLFDSIQAVVPRPIKSAEAIPTPLEFQLAFQCNPPPASSLKQDDSLRPPQPPLD